MSDNIQSYEVQTSTTPTLGGPVRLYTTGSNHKRVVLATGGEDNDVIGIAKNAPQTQGYAIAVAQNDGHRFLGYVGTTVAAGAKLKCGPGGTFTAAGAHTPTTAQTEPRYTALVLEARTNAGFTWLEFVKKGVV